MFTTTKTRFFGEFAMLLFLVCFVLHAGAAGFDQSKLDAFASEVAKRHNWDESELRQTLASAKRAESILKAISRPAEGKPWYEYRPIFLTAAREKAGVQFWKENVIALESAEREYGVPAKIIVAIIGVETFYGRIAGSYRVLDALATLGFAYPPRSKFFVSELEHFLLLCRAQSLNPTTPIGSYAGAMGMPQFMPSSYREYAVDFDGDGAINIWDNPTDAIGSVGSYLKRHGWKRGEDVAHKVLEFDAGLAELVDKNLKPEVPVADALGQISALDGQALPDSKVDVIALKQKESTDYWLGYQNFYAITRYNHSRMYAMAVFQLAQAIESRLQSATDE